MKNIEIYLPEYIRQHYILSFMYGSYVYGTNTDKSDKDIIVIVDDNIELENSVNGIKEIFVTDGITEYDFQIINNNTFKKMIYEHHIIAVESLFMSSDMYSSIELFNSLYAKYFILDKWKLRQVISKIVGNSYAKCHKKLTVEKDYDLYRSQKSLYHCIRLYMFGIQIGKTGKINDYSEANHYLKEILDKKYSWEQYKKEYKPLLNKLRSEMVLYCPKP